MPARPHIQQTIVKGMCEDTDESAPRGERIIKPASDDRVPYKTGQKVLSLVQEGSQWHDWTSSKYLVHSVGSSVLAIQPPVNVPRPPILGSFSCPTVLNDVARVCLRSLWELGNGEQ